MFNQLREKIKKGDFEPGNCAEIRSKIKLYLVGAKL